MERDHDGRWQVDSRSVDEAGGDGGDESEVFDGVVVCNGHFTEPRIAEIPGIYYPYLPISRRYSLNSKFCGFFIPNMYEFLIFL